jgi:hypothetical protein
MPENKTRKVTLDFVFADGDCLSLEVTGAPGGKETIKVECSSYQLRYLSLAVAGLLDKRTEQAQSPPASEPVNLEIAPDMATMEAERKPKACPRCGFSYRWDGACCAHCGYPDSPALNS